MNKAEMLKLADDVAGATGADARLDAEVMLAVHYPKYRFPGIVLNRKPRDPTEALERLRWDGGGGHYPWPAFTASLDAAMTLVPEASAWPGGDVSYSIDIDCDSCVADFTCFSPLGCENGIESGLYVRAATPALALTSACLRAVAEEEE